METLPERYAQDAASVLADLLGSRLVGVYLHGSAVLGGFDARRSDVDMLAVTEGPMTAAQQAATADALSDRSLPCPARRGLELSVVTIEVTQHPTAEPAFELHLTTAPADTRVVDGRRPGGDPDLVLYFAVCRGAGRLLGPGRPAGEVFAPVPDYMARAQMLRELRWGAENSPDEYAVLNACRAWRFAADGALLSKIGGGEWALGHVRGADRDLVEIALDRQRCVTGRGLDPHAVRRFVQRIVPDLAGAPGRHHLAG
jgi:Domain of unknown function (DUF4111)